MSIRIVEDRTLARIAYDVAGRQPVRAEACEVALGQALVVLRVLGIAAGPDMVRTLEADIAGIFADPAELARARAVNARRQARRPVDSDRHRRAA